MLYFQVFIFCSSLSARLHSDRERESGFYTGKIEAVDFGTNKYWVTFDRPGVGKHLIHDTEIKVCNAFMYLFTVNTSPS